MTAPPITAQKLGDDITYLANNHYENFPVGSLLLARKIRRPVRALYAFARCADDIADEGEWSTEQRLRGLRSMARIVESVVADDPPARRYPRGRGLRIELVNLIHRHRVPHRYLLDLIDAFTQDVRGANYPDDAAIYAYTARSANPVGRILLHLHQRHRSPWLAASDKICTALQLINFYQDVASDIRRRQRFYLPDSVLYDSRFGLPRRAKPMFLSGRLELKRLNPILSEQVRKAMTLLSTGEKEMAGLTGRLKWEVKLCCLGGLGIGRKLLARTDPYQSPKLHRRDWLVMLIRLLLE